MDELSDRERAIFEAASRLPPEQREAFLDQACGPEGQIRQRVLEALHNASAQTRLSPNQSPRETITLQLPPEEPGEKPADRIGPYTLLEKLGEGGMGIVWVAEQREPVRRRVALKVIKLGMDTKQVIARFEAERQALALMDHPNIAKVLDAGATDKGRPYFVMELVNGVRITDYCDRHNVPTRQRLELFIQVCKAVAHAHRKGIIHRDIKPPNILVTVHDSAPAPKIIDFGIAKAIAGQRLTDKTVYTAFEEFMGTPAYMSPEQAEMNPLGIDARTDIYALGVLLYELLIGLTPFDVGRFRNLGLDEIRRVIREEEPVPPSTRLATLNAQQQATIARHHQCDIPRLLQLARGDPDWIAMKCLDKDRTRRYHAADDLAADVQRHLNGEPIIARPPGQLYRLGKLIRRHKPVFTTAALTLLATSVVMALLAVAWPGLLFRSRNPEQRIARARQLLKHYDEQDAIPKAMFELKEALKSDANNARAWAGLGWANWLLSSEDDLEATRFEAFLCSSNALRLNDKNAEGHLVQGLARGYVRDWAAATNHLWTAKELTRSANPIVLVSLAVVYQDAGETPMANQLAELAERQADNDWDVFDRLGIFYKSNPDDTGFQHARQSFERAVQLAPDSPLAHRNLGQILLLQRASDLEVLKELERSLALRRSPSTLSALGSVYLRQRRSGTAADYFCEASRMDPSKYLYHVDAALALRDVPNRLTEATNHFTQALLQTQDTLKAGGEKPLVRAYQGLCHAGMGQVSEARADLEKALNEAGGDVNVLRRVRDGFRLLDDTNRVRKVEELIRSKAKHP